MTPALPSGCHPRASCPATDRPLLGVPSRGGGGEPPQRALLSDVAGRPQRRGRAPATRRGHSLPGPPPPPAAAGCLRVCTLQEGGCRGGGGGRSPASPLPQNTSPPRPTVGPPSPPHCARGATARTCTGGSGRPPPLPIEARRPLSFPLPPPPNLNVSPAGNARPLHAPFPAFSDSTTRPGC